MKNVNLYFYFYFSIFLKSTTLIPSYPKPKKKSLVTPSICNSSSLLNIAGFYLLQYTSGARYCFVPLANRHVSTPSVPGGCTYATPKSIKEKMMIEREIGSKR
jgi:hypothetical protein